MTREVPVLRASLFAFALAVAAACVVVGVAHWSHGAAWCVAGVLLAAWGWAMLSEGGDTPAASTELEAGDDA